MQEETTAAKPLSFVLGILEDGQFAPEAAEKLRELTMKMREHAENNGGKAKGSFTIMLELEVTNGFLGITPKMEARAPRARRKSSLVFMTRDGGVSLDNPQQLSLLGPRSVPAAQEVREVTPVKG